MDEMIPEANADIPAPFNGPIEIGLRALIVLNDAYPQAYPLQTLVIYDYLIVHSDDIAGGPPGLHPKTPHRSGELLVRRAVLQQGLTLYESRGLVARRYEVTGVTWGATERSAAFLDALGTEYVLALRERASWLIDEYGQSEPEFLANLVREHLGQWGAEFERESVLTREELQ
jgi:hypothetical protein